MANFGKEIVPWITKVRQEDGEAFKEFYERCLKFARWRFGYKLPLEDAADVVQAASLEMVETWTRDPEVENGELAKDLKRSIEKHRKRKQREPFSCSLNEQAAPRVIQLASPGSQLLEAPPSRKLLEAALELIFTLLKSMIPTLGERDQELVVRHYRLEPFFPEVAVQDRQLSPSALRKALYRARRKLTTALEEELIRQVDLGHQDKRMIDLCLRVVRKEAYIRAYECLNA